MALPIYKLNRALLNLNRSLMFFTFKPKNRFLVRNLTFVSQNTRYFNRDSNNMKFITNRRFLSALSSDDVRKEVDSISIKFTDAVELINDAKSSMGTIYFTDDMKDADQLVGEVLSDYKRLLSRLNETQRTDVQRTIGLKMEELKAQLTILKESIKEN